MKVVIIKDGKQLEIDPRTVIIDNLTLDDVEKRILSLERKYELIKQTMEKENETIIKALGARL
jgi:uncharacterized Ntn-hydrolase superfamily protein